LIWCASSSSGFNIGDGGSGSFPVVDVENDVNPGSGQAECTLLRIRGWIDINLTQNDVAGIFLIMGGVTVHEVDNPIDPPDWRNVDTYTREDVLWTFGGSLRQQSIVPTDTIRGLHFDVDVKAKRKLKSGQIVHVSMTADTPTGEGGEVQVFGAVRALCKLR